jgi:hypothetical protein
MVCSKNIHTASHGRTACLEQLDSGRRCCKGKFTWVDFGKQEPRCQERPKEGLQDSGTTGLQDQRMRGPGRCEWKPDRGCRFEDWQGERRGAKRWEEWEEWEVWETRSVERKAWSPVAEAMEDGGVLRVRR